MWERTLHQRISPRTLAVADDCIVTHARRSRLVCLGRWDGAVRWDVPFGLWPRSVVVAGDRCLGIAQNIDMLICWDLRTGAVLWNADLPRFTGHIVATGDTVLAGGWRGYTALMAFDLATGQPRWNTDGAQNTVLPQPGGDTVLIGENQGRDVSLASLHDGKELACWKLPEPLTTTDCGAIFAQADADRLFVRCGRRTVAEIRLDTGNIRVLRHHDTDLAPTAAQYSGGLLWLREARGYAAVDPTDGSLRWRVDIRQRLAENVVSTRSGFLIGGDQGTLLAMRIQAGRTSEGYAA
ncbi:outer membrane protein assembly factor BamB [Kitasatospora atroaurantiaca]|uniref:Outer membrane protein assembly factor BamB n=2 Tax=Kitasatospora atroaurantiaca TaxID=285545 RepID=A0A561EXD0_9ACTN|nr:outer membrane protein assembly factor BamB [Kitasatospora atroaurantiaca]